MIDKVVLSQNEIIKYFGDLKNSYVFFGILSNVLKNAPKQVIEVLRP